MFSVNRLSVQCDGPPKNKIVPGGRRRLRQNRLTAVLAAGVCLLLTASAAGQSFRRAGTEFSAVRTVNVPVGKSYSIVVVEFLHHGEIQPGGENVAVVAKNNELTPLRILQVGPGDFCRLAFQTIKGQSEYEIFYGGERPSEDRPPWTCRDGLLLATRASRPCDLRSLDSVRNAFQTAAPIGADYVENVFHGCNPFSLKREPFLSRYVGYLDIEKAGTYGFMTSSEDCSFLLIDDKPAAAAPGRHGPIRHARPGSRHDVQLSAGRHRFEYYHAAAGPNATMVAAWEVDPPEAKPRRPVLIPAEVFHADRVGRLQAGHVVLRKAKLAPDFTAKIAGDVPLPDNTLPLVVVSFRDASPKPLSMQGAKLHWDFGDGQIGAAANPSHVYLRPGLYAVTLSIRHGGKTLEMTNRIEVDRPLSMPGDKSHSLDECLKIIETYDLKTLDAASLGQLAAAFEAKASALAGRDESDANAYWAKAAAAGQAALADDSAAKGNEELLKLARMAGPIARLRLGDSRTAFQIWRGAAQRISADRPKAECEIAAADVAVNDLLQTAAAKTLLEAAAQRLGRSDADSVAAMWHGVRGDCCAAMGDGREARRQYGEAERIVGPAQSFAQRTARLGAHARSTEEFIKRKQYARAAEELDAWRRHYPMENCDGYLTLLVARYWFGRGKYALAIAQAERLQAVNADSPYMDQLLWIAAEGELRLGRKDRAMATFHALVKDYPGSPLAPRAKEKTEALEAEQKE